MMEMEPKHPPKWTTRASRACGTSFQTLSHLGKFPCTVGGWRFSYETRGCRRYFLLNSYPSAQFDEQQKKKRCEGGLQKHETHEDLRV